jgi:hypothetical protein
MINNDNIILSARKPDPPGEELFVHMHRYISANDNNTGTMSAVMDPSSTNFVNPDPPSTDNISQEESISMSCSMNGFDWSNGNSPDADDDLNSPDSATVTSPDADDDLLLSRTYWMHNEMMKYVNQYAAEKNTLSLCILLRDVLSLIYTNNSSPVKVIIHRDLLTQRLLLISNQEEDILHVHLNLLAVLRMFLAAYRHIIHLIQPKGVS